VRGLAVAACAVALMLGSVVALHDDVIPESDFVEMPEAERRSLDISSRLVASILDLQAYCRASYDVAVDYKANVEDTALVNLIAEFGAPVQDPNAVIAFAKAMGACVAKFPKGVGNYMLTQLRDTVMAGHSVVIPDKDGVHFSALHLGLKARPKYFAELRVGLPDWSTEKVELSESAHSAEAEAAANWLTSGSNEEYKSFKQQAEDDAQAQQDAYDEERSMHALKGIKGKWRHTKVLKPLPEAGVLSSMKAGPAPAIPDEGQIDAEAAKAAQEWVAEHSSTASSHGVTEEVHSQEHQATEDATYVVKVTFSRDSSATSSFSQLSTLLDTELSDMRAFQGMKRLYKCSRSDDMEEVQVYEHWESTANTERYLKWRQTADLPPMSGFTVTTEPIEAIPEHTWREEEGCVSVSANPDFVQPEDSA